MSKLPAQFKKPSPHYIKCRICGGQGWYPAKERIGSQIIERPVWCQYCGGKGEILESKVQNAERKVVRRNRAYS